MALGKHRYFDTFNSISIKIFFAILTHKRRIWSFKNMIRTYYNNMNSLEVYILKTYLAEVMCSYKESGESEMEITDKRWYQDVPIRANIMNITANTYK